MSDDFSTTGISKEAIQCRAALEFTIPYEVPSQNVTDRQHWSVRAREVKRLIWLFRAATHGTEPATGPRRVQIVAYRKRWIADHANLVGGCKRLVDAITKTGLLVDDSEKWATISYEQHVASAHLSQALCTIIAIYQ